MILDVAVGLFSAFLQSSAYLFSRRFVVKYGSPVELMIYTQSLMGIFGLATFLALLPFVKIAFTVTVFVWLGIFAVCGGTGSFCFFRALQEIEASRLGSLMGLKLIVLIPLNFLFIHTLPGVWQYVAVILATIAAVGMNFAGGRLTFRGIFYLSSTLFCYAMTDIAAAVLSREGINESVFLNALTATCLAFTACGIIPALMLLRVKFSWRRMADASWYAVFWFVAMILLFASFTTLGVLYGTIIQSSRGLISVLLGWVLLRLGFDKLEPRASRGAWIRRGVMAVIMIAAMALYTIK